MSKKLTRPDGGGRFVKKPDGELVRVKEDEDIVAVARKLSQPKPAAKPARQNPKE